jgi:hypothetical protein
MSVFAAGGNPLWHNNCYDTKPMSRVVETYLVVSSEAIASRFQEEIGQVFQNPGAKPITQADLDHVLALTQEREN